MNKAIFLDRDGVINKEIGRYVYNINDFVFNEGIFEKLKEFHNQGYLFIVISNQGGVAKGIYSKYDVETLNQHIFREFKKHDIEIAEIYYCPHHPDYTNCICRKPNSLLIEKAIARFNIDKSKSYFIGDMNRDIEAAFNAEIKGVKIEPNRIDQINL